MPGAAEVAVVCDHTLYTHTALLILFSKGYSGGGGGGGGGYSKAFRYFSLDQRSPKIQAEVVTKAVAEVEATAAEATRVEEVVVAIKVEAEATKVEADTKVAEVMAATRVISFVSC